MGRLLRRAFLAENRKQSAALEVVLPQRQMPLARLTLAVAVLTLASLSAWGMLASIAVSVEARGLVLPLGGVREISARTRGEVTARLVDAGQTVEAGDLLLRASDVVAAAAFDDAIAAYLQTETVLAARQRAAQQKRDDALALLAKQRDDLAAERDRLTAIAAGFETAVQGFRQVEGDMLGVQQQAASELKQAFETRSEGLRRLGEEGILAAPALSDFKRQLTDSSVSLSDIAIRASRAPIETQRLSQELSQLKNAIAGNERQVLEVAAQRAAAEADYEVSLDTLAGERLNARNQLLDLERQLWSGATIYAPYDGQVIAQDKSVGQALQAGEAVALMRMVPQERRLMLVLSPRAVEGQVSIALGGQTGDVRLEGGDFTAFEAALRDALSRLQPQATFTVLRRDERFVISVDGLAGRSLEDIRLDRVTLADARGAPAFAGLQVIGDGWSSDELTALVLLSPRDAKRVRVGAPALIKPDSEKALIGASIEARVERVGSYNTTALEAQALIGSREVAQVTAGDEQAVAAWLRFERDAAGALKLNRETLSQPLSVGATTRALIEVERLPPLFVILPFLSEFAS